jgi:hypothetical protein
MRAQCYNLLSSSNSRDECHLLTNLLNVERQSG